MGKDQHVVPHGDAWAIRGEGNGRVTSVHRTQEQVRHAEAQPVVGQLLLGNAAQLFALQPELSG